MDDLRKDGRTLAHLFVNQIPNSIRLGTELVALDVAYIMVRVS